MCITIQCGKCDARFEVSSKFQNSEPFVCQNCGHPLPDGMSEHIKKFLGAYNELEEDIHSANGYCIKFSEDEIIS